MLKMKLNRKEPINISSLIAKKAIAVVLLIVLFTCFICSCKAAGKNKPVLNTTETTEPTESSYGRIKGVVITGRDNETSVKETTIVPSETKETETSPSTETAAPTEPSETTGSNETAAPTKAPTRKATKKKATTKKTTKKKATKKKATTKKTTPTQTSNAYKYCTCDAKVSYGVSGGTHTFTGLTAQQSNGKWVLTSASTSKIVSWLNANVKDKSGKPNWQRYSTTITNTRNLRNSP